MSKKNGVCVEEVCYCIKEAIIAEDTRCLFIPEGMEFHVAWLDQWDDIDEENDEAIVIVNPIEEFEIDRVRYFRVIKMISWSIYDFRKIEEKFGIYVYLSKRYYGDRGEYVFYYKGKPVNTVRCPPTFADVRIILTQFPEFKRHLEEIEAIACFAQGFRYLRRIITEKL